MNRTVTIQQTGKRYKKVQLVGYVLLGLGAIVLLIALMEGSGAAGGWGAAIGGAGLVGIWAGKILAWWHHG